MSWDSQCNFLAGTKVLEVGCGAGLPGVFTFAAGANTHFNDYNKVNIYTFYAQNFKEDIFN